MVYVVQGKRKLVPRTSEYERPVSIAIAVRRVSHVAIENVVGNRRLRHGTVARCDKLATDVLNDYGMH